MPSPFRAKLWCYPPAIATTPVSPVTCTGKLLFTLLPFPSWPEELEPQFQTVPSLFSAKLCCPPPAIETTPVRPLTCTGALLLGLFPVPSSPLPLKPQAHTAPRRVERRLGKESR